PDAHSRSRTRVLGKGDRPLDRLAAEPLVRLTIRASAADAPAVLAEACDLLGAGCRERALPDGGAALDFWLPTAAAPSPETLRAALAQRGWPVAVEAAPERADWQAALRAFHQPVEIGGRLLLRPPWEPAREGLLDVVIDPGMAFGTGQHATTRGCLELLLGVPPGSLVDVGCGSGVLAIAACRLGHAPVRALDRDPLAIEATLANAAVNGVGLQAELWALGTDPVPSADTVLANLTADLMAPLAAAVAARRPRSAILSGLRPHEVPGAVDAWAPLGLEPGATIADPQWASVLLVASPDVRGRR
ncbi:MAG: ribosomal protein methyltransferase, partial [Miltoncostaeaceae bacterium]|nr:ribosomal protein methyltransferase [Miltoncostaeaceae bacterium]